MREAARLQGFPDQFRFEGSFDSIFKQIGEAVPPPFSTAIALQVLANIRGDFLGRGYNDLIDTPVSDSYGGIIAGIKRGCR
jgi:DNA (cytosine-5)-methyltransferase 1